MPSQNGSLVLLATGGTISLRVDNDGHVSRMTVTDLLASCGQLPLPIRGRDVAYAPSRAITPQDIWQLAAAVNDEIAAGARGVVITHGTDTVEETGYALSLLVDGFAPVVLTAAMRKTGTPGADGPANLHAAMRVAADGRATPYGPVLVVQDEIHVCRWVTKMYSSRVAAFASPTTGPVGDILEDEPQFFVAPPFSERLRAIGSPTKRVELVWAAAGVDGTVVDLVAEHVDGFVVAGTGGGHVAPPLAESLIRVAKAGLPVVLASRCPAGEVLTHSYDGVGSEIHLLGEGLLSAGDLSPIKARLRLIFGLSAGIGASELFA